MSEIRNLTRNGETFYPLTCTEGLVNRDGNVVGEINDIFDISEYNATGTPPVLATYSSLSLALAAVPQSKQKGGMTIRYVQTSDNKYVQWRLTANSFTTNVYKWENYADSLSVNEIKKTTGAEFADYGHFFDTVQEKFVKNAATPTFACFILPIENGDVFCFGIQPNLVNGMVGLSEIPVVADNEGYTDISAIIENVSTRLEEIEGRWYLTITNRQNASYIGFTFNISAANGKDYCVKIGNAFLTSKELGPIKENILITNLKIKADNTKGSSPIELLSVYFDLQQIHPNGYFGISKEWNCIIVPCRIGDTIKVPLISGLVNPIVLSSFPDKFGDLESGTILNSNINRHISGSYTEYTIENVNAQYFSVTMQSNIEIPILPLVVDSGNVTEKYFEEQIADTKRQIPNINHELGMVKSFNFGNYDDVCLIMNGQSLSIGEESVAISTDTIDNCYMLGTDPCTLYRQSGFNGVGINSLRAVTKESPNVSWCNVMSKLIQKRMITASVGEGAKTIAQLSKTDDASLVDAEFIGNGAIDPSNGHITLNSSSTFISFIKSVQPGETYYITGISRYITEYSASPRWSPVENTYNGSIYIGNGSVHISNNQYTVPDGVHYLGLCQNNSEYITKTAHLIKGVANRYEKGFILPMAQLKAVEDSENRTIGCPAIVWMQGESDSTNTKEYYKEKLVKLKNDMQADIMNIFGQDEKPLFFCYMLAVTSQKQNTIMMAIAECCEENDDMILIAPIYALPDYNNLHLSSNGYRWYGEYIARTTYNALVLGKRESCVTPYQFAIDGNNLRIKVNAPQLPLVIDTWTVQEIPQYGFKIWKDGVDISISSVTLFGDEIILHCNESLNSGIIEVSYAGYNPTDTIHYRGTGNVRDSDRWRSLQTYWDDTNDKGIGGTSTITYRPETENGSSLIGKPYPMQNWLQNFYKKVN